MAGVVARRRRNERLRYPIKVGFQLVLITAGIHQSVVTVFIEITGVRLFYGQRYVNVPRYLNVDLIAN